MLQSGPIEIGKCLIIYYLLTDKGKILDYDNTEKNGQNTFLIIFSDPEIVFLLCFAC